ncbi:hypothetical protein [Algoriphagus halophilus]|nr:hypothetical protein [Algoriphagus halophilus]
MKPIFEKCSGLLFLGILTFSCTANKNEGNEKLGFSLVLSDSLEVDYLGDLMLLDYDPEEGKYLLSNDTYYEYVEVEGSGEILNHHQFNSEGIDAVETALGLGYVDGNVTVLTPTNGYYQFEDSLKVGQIEIPYSYQIFMFYPKLGVFKENNQVYFPSLWPETFAINMNEGEFYKKLYRLPILSKIDESTGDTLGVVRLPETSKLLNGQVHGFPIPVYTKSDELLLLSMWIEPRFYVYNQEGDHFDYDQTVELNIPNWVHYDPVSEDQAEKFFEEYSKKIPGNLTNLFQVGSYYIATYTKGISEDVLATMNRQDPNFGFERRKKDPHLAAVFDQDFNQVAVDLPFPKASDYPMVVNKQGELVVSKDGNLSDTEDDGMILYKLKLVKK